MKTLSELQGRLDELAGCGDSVEWVDAVNELADRRLFTGEAGTLLGLAEDAVAMAKRLGYASGEAYALFHLGTANWLVTRLEPALSTLLEAEAVAVRDPPEGADEQRRPPRHGFTQRRTAGPGSSDL